MDPFITIAVFSLPQEAYIIRSKLQAMGIEVMLKDELTIQVDNFLSNALGGVKLQVRESDAKQAKSILLEADLLIDTVTTTEKTKTWFERQTDRIPLIQRWPTSLRAISIIGLALLFACALLIALQPPPSEERLAAWDAYEKEQAQQKLDWVYLPRADSLINANPILAVAYIQEVFKEFPENPNLFKSLGLAYYQMDSLELAIRQFELSLKYSSRDDENVLVYLGACKIESGDVEGSIRYLDRAAMLHWEYKYDLGYAYELLKDQVNAEKYYAQYLETLEKLNPLIIGDANFKKLKTKVARMKKERISKQTP
ncbi:MAG: hypothetical protein Roseis2KO_09020 [Roseivirga sp.]